MVASGTPCQSKSGIAGIASRSGLALSCRRNRGVLLVIAVRPTGDAGPHTQRDEWWLEDEEFMDQHYAALSGVPTRVVLLHSRKNGVRLGIVDSAAAPPWENSYMAAFPALGDRGDEYDPILTGRQPWWNARFIGVSLGPADQRLAVIYNQPGESQREQPMVPVDETREPFDRWNNTDPADHDIFEDDGFTIRSRNVGMKGYTPLENEYEREVEAFREEHGHYPKLMMIITNDDHLNAYDALGDRNHTGVSAFGLHDLPDQHDLGDSFRVEGIQEWTTTHLSHRTALGNVMRGIRDKYGIQSEFSEYDIYPDAHFENREPNVEWRLFHEVGERLKRALTIDGPPPGAPDHFAIPWPPGGTP